MDNGERFPGKRLLRLSQVILLALSNAMWAQGPPSTPTREQSSASQDSSKQDQKQADKACPELAEGNVRPTQAAQEPPKPKEEVKITPREAEELFHSVDEILAFDSKQTGLPIKKAVKRKLTSREEVVSYLTKHMNDEDTQRLRRSELVLKKFGLLPRDFDLEKLHSCASRWRATTTPRQRR